MEWDGEGEQGGAGERGPDNDRTTGGIGVAPRAPDALWLARDYFVVISCWRLETPSLTPSAISRCEKPKRSKAHMT